MRTALALLFGVAYLVMGASCLGLEGSHHWRVLRILLGACNGTRLAVVLIMYWAAEPRPSSYPPDLSFTHALLNSLVCTGAAIMLTPSRREAFARRMGANSVSLRLDEIQRFVAWRSGTPPMPRPEYISGNKYIEELERRVEELTDENRKTREELLLYRKIRARGPPSIPETTKSL